MQGDPQPAPAVDFSAEMVVAVFLGEEATGGYEVEVTRAELAGSNLRLYYREKGPPPDAIVAQVLTQPYHIVKLPKYRIPAIFWREDQ